MENIEPTNISKILAISLDTLDSFCKWFLSVSVVIWWAGLSNTVCVIKILDIEIARSKSFIIAGIFFFVMNLIFFQHFRRIHLLLKIPSNTSPQELLRTLFFHCWMLNPFGIYGWNKQNKVSIPFHIAFLVVIWWLCNMSLYALYPDFEIEGIYRRFAFYAVVFCSFGYIGLLTLKEILEIFATLKEMVIRCDEETRILFNQHFALHRSMLSAGVIAGLAITCLIIFL